VAATGVEDGPDEPVVPVSFVQAVAVRATIPAIAAQLLAFCMTISSLANSRPALSWQVGSGLLTSC